MRHTGQTFLPYQLYLLYSGHEDAKTVSCFRVYLPEGTENLHTGSSSVIYIRKIGLKMLTHETKNTDQYTIEMVPYCIL